MIPLLNGILTGGDVFTVKLSKKNWFIRKWRRRHLKRWSEVQKTTFSGFKVLVFRMLEGFIQRNRRIFTLQISAFRLSSTSHPTTRLFWSNFSNWSSLFSPGSISVSDKIHQAAFPSKVAVIKLLNSMEITLAYDTADGMASSSDQQIIIFSTDSPQLQCDFLGDAFFSTISGASKSHGFRCSSTKTSKP